MQRLTVETIAALLAVGNDAADPFVNIDYYDSVAYANPWEGRCHRLDGQGRASFWKAAAVFMGWSGALSVRYP